MFRKRLLPEAHTDFIFAITLEELGIIGGLAIFRIVDVYDCANYFSRCTLEETF